MNLSDMSLRDLMQAICERPGMYLPGLGKSKSVSILDAYVRGFCDGREKSTGNSAARDLSQFQQWYQETIGPDITPLSVARLLLEKFDGNQERSFDEFFRLWARYITENREPE